MGLGGGGTSKRARVLENRTPHPSGTEPFGAARCHHRMSPRLQRNSGAQKHSVSRPASGETRRPADGLPNTLSHDIRIARRAGSVPAQGIFEPPGGSNPPSLMAVSGRTVRSPVGRLGHRVSVTTQSWAGRVPTTDGAKKLSHNSAERIMIQGEEADLVALRRSFLQPPPRRFRPRPSPQPVPTRPRKPLVSRSMRAMGPGSFRSAMQSQPS